MADISTHVKTRPRGGRDEHNYEYYQHSNEEAKFLGLITLPQIASLSFPAISLLGQMPQILL